MTALYDVIGDGYSDLRRPDPKIAARIRAALGDLAGPDVRILNVGAGAGNYEPTDIPVLALEPSALMIAQRPAGAAPVIQGRAEALPFADGVFEASLAVLTVHHWSDAGAGLRELRRVTRGRVVILTFDPAARPWLTDYLPALAALDTGQMPTLETYALALGPVTLAPVEVPRECSDGFLYAYWARPEAYLDPRLRAANSSFRKLGEPELADGLARLKSHLETGEWDRRYPGLRDQDGYDAGYRLIVSD